MYFLILGVKCTFLHVLSYSCWILLRLFCLHLNSVLFVKFFCVFEFAFLKCHGYSKRNVFPHPLIGKWGIEVNGRVVGLLLSFILDSQVKMSVLIFFFLFPLINTSCTQVVYLLLLLQICLALHCVHRDWGTCNNNRFSKILLEQLVCDQTPIN